MNFSNRNRKKVISDMTSRTFDVLIIGGGITGAGIALDATLRGMDVALVDMQDFAAGTSSRSTKLIHGGLRYLKQLEFGLVAEIGKEREIVYNNGPHVSNPEWMLLPIYKNSEYGRFTTSMGLRLYDFLASVHKNERRIMLSPQECIEKIPNMRIQDLLGGGYYVEYRTDDARLTIEVIKAAVANKANCLNYMKVEQLHFHSGKVCGATVYDLLTGDFFKISAKKVVNATGPWVDSLRELDGSKQGKTLQLTKGVHIVFDQSDFPLNQGVYFDTPDGRMIFAIPRSGKTYVGTTDTLYNKDPLIPKVTQEDREYLIQSLHYMFPTLELNNDHIESSWAGIRPLIMETGKNPSEISRKDEIWISDSGLITIAGGKLTGYRKMSEMVVDLLVKTFKNEENHQFDLCQTKSYPISGGDFSIECNYKTYVARKTLKGVKVGLTVEEAQHLVSIYGSNVSTLYHYFIQYPDEAKESDLPRVLWAKLKYSLDHEMIVTPLDFFYRRTGLLLFDIGSVQQYKREVIHYMAKYFQWDEEILDKYGHQLDIAIHEAKFSVEDL